MANPTLLWQLTLPDGSSAHCLLFPTWPTHTVVWYVNEQVHQIHPFRDSPQVMAIVARKVYAGRQDDRAGECRSQGQRSACSLIGATSGR